MAAPRSRSTSRIGGAPKGRLFSQAAVRPDAAFSDPNLRLFLLRYDDVRRAAVPNQAILEFFRSTYEAAAILAGWDRQALERTPPKGAPR